MAKFEKGNTFGSKGRPKSALGKNSIISNTITTEALLQLDLAVRDGQSWSIIEVLKRVSPTLKQVTPDNSLDAEYLRMKILQVSELELRITELEERYK